MDVNFIWNSKIDSQLMKESENSIISDINEHDDLKACHPGTVSVSISSSDPLDFNINGNINCQCGKVIATFNGKSDGLKIDYTFT